MNKSGDKIKEKNTEMNQKVAHFYIDLNDRVVGLANLPPTSK